MSAGPTAENIMDALNDSGYLMEQEVASQFERLGYHVTTNHPFEDKDEGKSREIDVRAVKRIAMNDAKKISAYLEIIAECKNSANPFVFIERVKTQRDRQFAPAEYRFPFDYEASWPGKHPGSRHIQPTSAFHHLGFDKIHYAYLRDAKAVQFCRIDRKGGGWHANQGGLYDAIFYPMAKAVKAQSHEFDTNVTHSEWKHLWFFVPMVVVSGDLYRVDSMRTSPVPEPCSVVTFRRELRGASLSGTFSIDFVRQDYLETFDRDCLGPIARRVEQLLNEEIDLLLKKNIEWKGPPPVT